MHTWPNGDSETMIEHLEDLRSSQDILLAHERDYVLSDWEFRFDDYCILFNLL